MIFGIIYRVLEKTIQKRISMSARTLKMKETSEKELIESAFEMLSHAMPCLAAIPLNSTI